MKRAKSVWMFIALMLIVAAGSAQGWRSGRVAGNNIDNSQRMCVNLLTDLTSEQKEKLTQLVNAHQETMDGLRAEQRSTFDLAEKNDIREEMLQKVQAHRNEVRNLLTEDQQKQLDMMQTTRQNRGRGYAAQRSGFRGRGGICRPGLRGGW